MRKSQELLPIAQVCTKVDGGSEKQSVSISESSIDSPLFIDDDYDWDDPPPHQSLDEVVVSVGSVKSIVDHINFLENSKKGHKSLDASDSGSQKKAVKPAHSMFYGNKDQKATKSLDASDSESQKKSLSPFHSMFNSNKDRYVQKAHKSLDASDSGSQKQSLRPFHSMFNSNKDRYVQKAHKSLDASDSGSQKKSLKPFHSMFSGSKERYVQYSISTRLIH